MKQEEKITCAYCGKEINEGKAVSAQGLGVVRYACSWRHLHKYLVETFTTGSQITEGLEKIVPTTD